VNKPAEQWYSGDWFRAVDVRKCSWAVRGIWREMLDVMANEQEIGKIHGTKEEICRLIGCTQAELNDLIAVNKAHKFADVTIRHKKVTIINRRMHRAFLAREAAKIRKRQQRNRESQKSHGDVTPYSSTSTSKKDFSVTSVGQKKEAPKAILYPLPGKTCCVRGCGMPAVYKSSTGEYDAYYCSDHMPAKVKAKYG